MTPLTPELSQLLPELSQLANTITRLTILYEVTRMANEPSLSDEERWICFGELSSDQPLVTREPRSSFKLLPQPQRQRGRRPTYDYTLINEELLKIAIEKGWPYFKTHMRFVIGHIRAMFGTENQPADSTLREHVKKWVAANMPKG